MVLGPVVQVEEEKIAPFRRLKRHLPPLAKEIASLDLPTSVVPHPYAYTLFTFLDRPIFDYQVTTVVDCQPFTKGVPDEKIGESCSLSTGRPHTVKAVLAGKIKNQNVCGTKSLIIA